jgi:hypothetical protein
MSFRRAAVLAAAGTIADILVALYYALTFGGVDRQLWLEAAGFLSQLLMACLFVMIYREQGGTGQPRRRQDLAIAAVVIHGILLHVILNGFSPAIFSNKMRAAAWVVDDVLLPVCWIAFLILLVKDADPWTRRPMRVLAPIMTIATAAFFCWTSYFLFIRVGLEWLNLLSQRSLWALVWNLLLLPALEVFRNVASVIFLAVLWRYSWAGRKSQIAGSSLPNTQEQNP